MKPVLLVMLVVLAVSLQTLVGYPAKAKTLAVASEHGVTIRLTDGPCQLDAVTNLPGRITWSEAGKTTEGCFSMSGNLVVAYFADRTVALIPLSVMRPAVEA